MNMRKGLNHHHESINWLENLIMVGREGEDDPYERDAQGAIVEEDGEQVLKEGWEYDSEDKPVKVEESNSGDDPKEEDTPEKKLADMEEALRSERRLRRQAEKEARQAKKKVKAEVTDDDKSKEELQTERTKTERLAQRLLNTQLDTAIEKAARKLGFIDPTDALLDSVRREVDYEQDDEDPSDIDIDIDSVNDAVGELAKKKKHLVGKATPGERSGSRQRRNSHQSDEELSEAALKTNYPSLG